MRYMENGAEGYIAGRAVLDALDAAEDPQYQQAVDPRTGEPVFYGDGTPMLFPVPLAQRVAPGVKRRLETWLWFRVTCFWFIVLAFSAVVLIRVAGPDWMGDWLYDYGLPVLFTGLILGAAAFVAGFLVRIVYKMIKFVFTRRL
jgi:hypothetical protein